MKRLLLAVCCLSSVLAMPQRLEAQQVADSTELTLDQALQIALSDNPDVKVAERTIQIQKYAKKETITGLFPSITASASGSKSVILQKMKLDFSPEPISMGQPFVYSVTGSAAMPLVVPQLWKTLSLNEEQVQLALEQARSSKVDAIAKVKEAYYSLLLARDSREALLASLRTAERNAQDTKLKYELGSVSEYDKLQADVQLASIRPNLLDAENSVKLAEMRLKVLMGVDIDEPLKFLGRLSDYEEDLFSDLLRLKADTALTNNSALSLLDHRARILRISETINRLGYLPTLALSFQAGYQGMTKKFNPAKASYFPNATVALAFSWTIFDGMQKYMKTKQNKLQLENLEIQREDLVRQLELGVESALNSIETAAEQVVSTKESVYSAERAHNISERRYSVGSGTMLEVTASETALLSARLQYVQSIYIFLSSRAKLEQTLGKAVE